jgi:hypothetical protein
MIEIEKFECADSNEARARERHWYEELGAKLNIRVPIINNEERIQNQKKYYEAHAKELKEYQKKYNADHAEELTKYKADYREKQKKFNIEYAEKQKKYNAYYAEEQARERHAKQLKTK